MTKTFQLYYYATDNERQVYANLLPNIKDAELPPSELEFDTTPIYDSTFKKIGTLGRVIPAPYINDKLEFGQYYQNFILDDGTITVVFNYVSKIGEEFFPPGVKVPFTYQYGSGAYFNKKISGYLLPFGNKVDSRAYVFNMED